jgi:hypothetical protein
MMSDPTREEWLAARQRIAFADDSADAGALTLVVLGPCPPEPPPEWWRLGKLMVGAHTESGRVWVGFPYAPEKPHEKLTPEQADYLGAALTEHAHYLREQDYDPWRSDEEAAALIDAIKEPATPEPICGHLLCQRPKGHPGGCSSYRQAADGANR